jgi:LmbE family N-acetylglucosaminyl deacetylase/glycosyltransferase involved in cell wall biosynthesis
METEEKLIPYHSTDLTGKRVLVLAPHPDDETFGCGGSLVLHAKAGDQVKVVFLTNGAMGDTSGEIEREEYVEMRQNEAVRACACFGVKDLEFWSYEDRSLAGSRGALLRMIDLLESFRPELVYAPSPMEFHPDHRATCFLLCDAISGFDSDFEVAFYELGQPLSVNILVDITDVLSLKMEAMDCYESQLKERPYKDIWMALNRYRSMTLPEGATHAEGFSLWNAGIIRKAGPFSIPFQRVHRFMPDPGEAGPLVSVIVRTKDRPRLLGNALRSIANQTYANLEIVVVNDGGEDVKDLVDALTNGIPVTYISHGGCRGRSAAANSGIKAARGLYLNLLDEDDVFYPDHVETLVRDLAARNEKIAYSSVVSVYLNGPPGGPESLVKREINHNIDFDPERLLFQNYIPNMSVLFHREVHTVVGEFCGNLTLFEDWDFWIRASRHFTFHHVDKVTAEYRFYNAQDTEGSHRQKYDYDEALARIFERVIPYLKGDTWIRFLNSNVLPGLWHGRKGQDHGDRLREAERDLTETRQRLQETDEAMKALEVENDSRKRLLEEIFCSRGWVWLTRYRAFKRKLGFDRKMCRQGEAGSDHGESQHFYPDL